MFYRRALNYRLICEPRPYPLLTRPVSLMTVLYPAAADELYRRYPFFRSTFFERRMLFGRPMAGSLQSGASTAAGDSPTFC